ncbi:MAG: D-isomer specific 2-hydroxyacid dehydrogenase family protein [Halanaerobiaceae bacterium]
MGEQHKIAVVNSSTFGRYFSDLMERLENIGEVKRFNFDPDIEGGKLAEELKGYDYIIASVTPDFSAEFFAEQEEIKLLARHGIGYDNVDIEAATSSGVIVTNVKGIHERDAVAELALSLIMTCIRDIVPAQQAVIDGDWEARRKFVGNEVSKMTVGIIGYGNIGSRTAEIIKEGFGSEVLAYDPNIADAVIQKNGIKPVGFTEILEKSDILSLHASANEDNYHFIGKEEFELMKDGVIIVNTARGELMVEEELAQAVKDGKVGAVGLDVAEVEPMSSDHPLVGLDRVIIVPHIGGYTDYSLREMDEKMVIDVEKHVAGEIPNQVVNPRVLKD